MSPPTPETPATHAEALARRVREASVPEVQLAHELEQLFGEGKRFNIFLLKKFGSDGEKLVKGLTSPDHTPSEFWFPEAAKLLNQHGYLNSERFELLIQALKEERPFLHDPVDPPVVPAGKDAVLQPRPKALPPGVWAAVGVLAVAIIGLVTIVWPPPPPPSSQPMALTMLQLPPGDQALPKLMAALARLGPRAIVLDQPLRDLAAAHSLAPALRPLVEADPPIPLVVAPSPSGPPPTDAELDASACDVAAVRVMTELPEGVVGCALEPLDCDGSSEPSPTPLQRGCLTVLSGVMPQALLPPKPELAHFSFSLGPTLNTCEVDTPTLPFVVKRLAFPANLFASLNAESAAQAVLLRAGCACQECLVGLPLREPPASPEEAPWRTLPATELLSGTPTEATRAAVQGQVVLVMTQADRSVELTLDGGQLRAMSPGETIATLAWSLAGP